MQNLSFTEWIMIISIILTLISIIIHICVLKALKNTTSKSVTEKIGGVAENLANTAAKVLKTLKLDGVSDVISLIKELITKDTPENVLKEKSEENGTNGK